MWITLWDKLIFPTLCKLGKFIIHRPIPIILGIISGILCFVIGELYIRNSAKEVTVLLGPRGSNGRYLGERIATKLSKVGSTPGIKYSISKTYTGGYDDMYDILSSDSKGLTIGFGMDNGDKELRVLLPLDWDYLHILVSTDFIKTQCGGKRPKELSDIALKLRERRVFFGSKGSASKRLSESILEYYHKDVSKYHSLGINDWEDVRSAFQCGEIDLAFFVGQLDSTSIRQIAWDGKAILIGLDSIADAIARNNQNGVIKSYFSANTYRASVVDDDILFCDKCMTTLSTRRLILTNKSMSDLDAFIISSAIKDELTGDLPLDPWTIGDPIELNPTKVKGIRTLDHPGASLVKKNLNYTRWWVMSSWPPSIKSGVFGVISFISALMLGWYAERLKKS